MIKVNGEENKTPYTPDSPSNPSDPYGISKWEAEQAQMTILGFEFDPGGLNEFWGPSGVRLSLLSYCHYIRIKHLDSQ